ncbi:MAG TPA: hypothetical protein ENI07_19665 [Desulfobacterales bacterium]|nr:hypothetical protein [Desulfobacterales bacterium]
MRYFNHRYVVSLLFISVLFLSEGVSAQESEGWSEANATVLNEVSVYLKKPEYIGLFGLGSLFTNKLEVVYANYKLPEGARIRLLEKWDTGARGYRYVRFQWQHNGKRKEGWTWAGKKPNYWLTIQPDNATEPFASHISHSSISIPGHRFSGIGEQFLSFFVGKAYAGAPVGVPTQLSGYDQERQVPGRRVSGERSALNFFILVWTSLFVTTVSFAKDGIKDKFRHRFHRAYLYYSSTFAGITVLGFLEAIVVKAIDAGFFGG